MVEALVDFGEGEDLEEGVYNQGSFFLVRHVNISGLKSLQHGSEYSVSVGLFNICSQIADAAKFFARASAWLYLVPQMLARVAYLIS
jgi:hypothetical protein